MVVQPVGRPPPVLYPQALEDIKTGGGIIEGGHFVNGRDKHSATWVDLKRVIIRPTFLERCAQGLDLNDVSHVKLVTGPSAGADALTQWLAYYLEASFAIPIEKRISEGKTEWMVRDVFREHFEKAAKNGGVLLCDDVLHTGVTLKVALKRILEIVPKKAIRGVAVILNRGEFTDTFEGFPLHALVTKRFPEYEMRNCPLCEEGVFIRTDFGIGARVLNHLAMSGHADDARRLGWKGK